jgi:hypothetical protein
MDEVVDGVCNEVCGKIPFPGSEVEEVNKGPSGDDDMCEYCV